MSPKRLAPVTEKFARLGLDVDDEAAWRSSGLPDTALTEWLTDRVARRPTGARARAVYGADDAHSFARRAILGALGLSRDDRLLEIGCGGGLLLHDALAAGASACGVDHSEEMVRLARERAPGAQVVLAGAEALPFADGAFTAAAMSMVFMFLPDPDRALRECRRVLAAGGALAVHTASPALRGTPAVPAPIDAVVRLYADDELAALAARAGFSAVQVVDDDGAQLLTARC